MSTTATGRAAVDSVAGKEGAMGAQASTKRGDAVEEFFDRIAATPQPLLREVRATVRFDIEDHGRGSRTWLLRIDHTRARVSRRAGKADAVVKTDRAMFEKLITGEANPLAAALRGRVRLDGDVRLLAVFARTLPGPPGGTTIVPPADRTAKEAARAIKATDTSRRAPKFSAAAARASRKDGER